LIYLKNIPKIVNYKNRLSCNLKIGSNTEDLPEIQVYDYDEIAENTIVTIYFAKIKTLPVGITATISLGARLYYREKYGIVYVYKLIDYLPGANTAFAGLTETSGTVSFSSSSTVLSTNNYQFTFALTSSITNADYFAFQFPLDMFDRYADSYDQVSTDIAGSYN